MMVHAAMLKRTYEWCLDAADKPYALWILAAVAFAESSFFPIPPDIMLLPMSLARPKKAWWFATVCTIASVAGGVLGYAIGALLYDWGEALFYTTHLRSRRLSTREQRLRRRSEYTGTQTWISLSAPADATALDQVDELGVRALVTNRELPELLTFAGDQHFTVPGVPARAVTVLRAPTRPRPSPSPSSPAATRASGSPTTTIPTRRSGRRSRAARASASRSERTAGRRAAR